MLNEVYNANPVIFAPSKASSRQNFKQKQSIWLDDAFDAEDDGLEEIDSQEIFGMKLKMRPLMVSDIVKTSFVQFLTRNTL